MAAPTTESYVLDASVAAKWHLPDEEHVDPATLLLHRFLLEGTRLVAPSYLRVEVASAITAASHVHPPRLSADQAETAIHLFLQLDLPVVPAQPLFTPALRLLVHRYRCSFYDALYPALAERLGVPPAHQRPSLPRASEPPRRHRTRLLRLTASRPPAVSPRPPHFCDLLLTCAVGELQ